MVNDRSTTRSKTRTPYNTLFIDVSRCFMFTMCARRASWRYETRKSRTNLTFTVFVTDTKRDSYVRTSLSERIETFFVFFFFCFHFLFLSSSRGNFRTYFSSRNFRIPRPKNIKRIVKFTRNNRERSETLGVNVMGVCNAIFWLISSLNSV